MSLEYTYIDSASGVQKVLSRLQQCEWFSIDLEFDKNRYRFGFNMCLMQIATDDDCFLIDPLAESVEVERLFPLIESPAIEKLVFAFGEDMRLFKALGCSPSNINDLSMALRILDYPALSLTNALIELLDIQSKPSSQKSNWFTRPLTNAQLDYAAEDVLYLNQLRSVIEEKALAMGRKRWIEEENEAIENKPYEVEALEYLKEKDKRGLTEHQWCVFSALMAHREKVAEELNRPSYQVIDKEYMLGLATGEKQMSDWNATPRMHRALKQGDHKRRFGEVLKGALEHCTAVGMSASEPATKRLNGSDLRAFRQEKSRKEHIREKVFRPIQASIKASIGENACDYIFNNRTMMSIIEGDARTLPAYRIELLKNHAQSLNADIGEFLP